MKHKGTTALKCSPRSDAGAVLYGLCYIFSLAASDVGTSRNEKLGVFKGLQVYFVLRMSGSRTSLAAVRLLASWLITPQRCSE